VAQNAIRTGETESVVFHGLEGGGRKKKKQREDENGWE
jgi:hypothetical protein